MQALKKYPGIKVVKQTFTGWQFATGGKQILDILNSGMKVDGVWTSGIDYTIVNAFKTARQEEACRSSAPTTTSSCKQLMTRTRASGRRRHEPGHDRRRRRRDRDQAARWADRAELGQADAAGVGQQDGDRQEQIKANYSPSRPPTYSARLQIKPWTTYTDAAALRLQGAVGDEQRAGAGVACGRPSRLSAAMTREPARSPRRREALRPGRRARVGRARRRAGGGPRAARRERRRQEHARQGPHRRHPRRRAAASSCTASRSASRSPAQAARIGLAPVFQDPALVPDLTVAQNLRLTGRRSSAVAATAARDGASTSTSPSARATCRCRCCG